MNKHIKNTLLTVTGIAALGLAYSETIHFLLSHRKANLDFIFKDNSEPSDFEKSLKEVRDADKEWVLNNNLQEYTITSEDGLALKGYLLPAQQKTDKYVFCIHGYRMTGLAEYDSIIRFYHNLNVNVFFIDQRSCGRSEGTYITYGGKEHKDCLLWLSFMLKEFGEDIKIILHGISLGSATTMLVCGNPLPENVKFAICDCGYASVKGQLMHNFNQYKMPAALSYNAYRISSILHGNGDPEKTAPVIAMENCTIPVIIAHGTEDTFVPFDMVYAIYDACPSENKKLITVSGAEHARAFFVNDEIKDAIKDYIIKFM